MPKIVLTKKENKVDAHAYKWYCDTIGIDAIAAIKKINSSFSITR